MEPRIIRGPLGGGVGRTDQRKGREMRALKNCSYVLPAVYLRGGLTASRSQQELMPLPSLIGSLEARGWTPKALRAAPSAWLPQEAKTYEIKI